jgi:hypothetical protein
MNALFGEQDPTRDERRFVDAHGTLWTVWERDARRDPGAQADYCLIFDNGSIRRRVWNYPPYWHSLPESVLIELADRA